jgi:LacI family transcriptional regulator
MTQREKRVTLRVLSDHLGLSPTTISRVLNGAPGADAIPADTQQRIFSAARELAYRPNFHARTLRTRRSFSFGVVAPEIGDSYTAGVIGGIERRLLSEGYFYFVASHRSDRELLQRYLALLEERAVEGLLLVNAPVLERPRLPTVAVAGHTKIEGVTNVAIDHDLAASAALSHLLELGHRRIAFFRGHPDSADSEDRWRAILGAAETLELEIDEDLTLQLRVQPSERWAAYREGYDFGRRLLERRLGATSLFAFDDVSAIGAMRAFLDAGLAVPGDISVVGFDDIESAAFLNPSLTTIRQPLRRMGEIAAEVLLARLGDGEDPGTISVEPELVTRASTGPAPS